MSIHSEREASDEVSPTQEFLNLDRECEGNQTALHRDLQALDQSSVRVRFQRNVTIFNEGDNADHAYKVINGMVRLCKHTQDGRRQITDFLLPGNLFGIIDRGEYGFSAEAVTAVILIAYPRSQIDRLSATKPEVVSRIFAVLTDQFMTMQQHLVVLGCRSAKERVAAFLVRLADRSHAGRGARLELPMGRQDIASHLGLTIETVCRALSELKREDSVIIPNLNQIVLKNLEALRILAEGARHPEKLLDAQRACRRGQAAGAWMNRRSAVLQSSSHTALSVSPPLPRQALFNREFKLNSN
jgi:CRP-like cAMP-binding protein